MYIETEVERGCSSTQSTSPPNTPDLYSLFEVWIEKLMRKWLQRSRTVCAQLKSEKDWLVWKFQVMHAMKAAGLWDCVTRTANREGAENASAEQKAFYFVLQCIGQKYVPTVMSCETPKDLWDTLTQLFERKTVSNKIYTLMQLYGLHMRKGARILDHLRELDELSNKLAAIGEGVTEVHKVAVLLRSVQESYPTLVTAFLPRGDDEFTLVFIKQALLDGEQRHGKSGSSSGGTDSKDSNSALKTGQKYNRRRRPGACHHCGQKGHYI